MEKILFETGQAESFLDQAAMQRALERAGDANRELVEGSGPGAEWLGWRRMLRQPDDALLEQVDATASSIRQEADVLVVCGIGGSYLGARALLQALQLPATGDGPQVLFAGQHLGGGELRRLITYLETPKPDGEPRSVFVNVISKSGTTLEPALAFRVLRDWMHRRYAENAARRILCTTSKQGGALNQLAKAHGYTRFVIPGDVGGRYSVLTPVGLLPAAVGGLDIRSMFYGAVGACEQIEKNPGQVVRYAGVRHALHEKGYTVDLLSSFHPELSSFQAWMQQLFGESEGKNGKGVFPACLAYTTDLHSVGQMVQQGRRNMMETFLEVSSNNEDEGLRVPADPGDHDGLNWLAGRSFHDINERALEGTRQAHVEGGVPAFTLRFHDLSAPTLGYAIYALEHAVSVYVYCLGENPFDQPGVEQYKQAMFRLLGKP